MVLSEMTYDDIERSLQGQVDLYGPIPWKRCMLVRPSDCIDTRQETICR